jgi:hypothetical protein
MRIRLPLGALGMACLAACGAPHPTGGESPADPQDVASVRLFDGAGTELTFHMPLNTGETIRVEVRMYAANGHQIVSVTGGEELDWTFSPSTLASSTPVDSEPLKRDVTPSDPPGTLGTLEVALHFPGDQSTKTFGPFDVLVH